MYGESHEKKSWCDKFPSYTLSSLACLLCLLAAGKDENCWAQQNVIVNPGDNLQALVNQYPTGTTFTLMPGTYRLQTIEPKDYDTFTAQTARSAIVSGAELLTTFIQSGAYWTAHVQVTEASSYVGECGSNTACAFPEDLFFDNVPKMRVAGLAMVGPGAWYLDYSTGTAYMADNPAGHTVEISLTRYGFQGMATNVTVSNLIVEKYACWAETGAIDGSAGNYWEVSGNEVRFNHGEGIKGGNGSYIHSNYVHTNGELGVGGNGSNITVQNNEISYNNYADYTIYWEAGGAKFATVQGLTFQYNYCHNNVGPGFWVDLDAQDVLCNGNQFTANEEAGIMIEISSDVTVSNNYIWNDAYNPDGSTIYWSDGILIEDSTYVSVFFNQVANCVNGIGGLLQNRGYGPNNQQYVLQNVDVNSNIITQQTGIALGIAIESAIFDNSVYTSWNNQFQYNTLNLANPSGAYIFWLNQPMTVAAWAAVLATQ